MKEGITLLMEKPFVCLPQTVLRNGVCGNCFSIQSELKRCSACSYVFYCSTSCQKKSWFLHKKECRYLKNVQTNVPHSIHLLIRLVLKLQTHKANEKSYYGENMYRTFENLMSNVENIKNDNVRMEQFHVSATLIENILYDVRLDKQFLLELFGKMVTNTFSILNEDNNVIGSGIYLAASSIDHSCNPNAVSIFCGNMIHIRTVKEMPNFNWNDLRISYIELLNIPSKRQKELQDTYYFLCECINCISGVENNLMNSMICPDKNCEGLIYVTPEFEQKNYNCLKCGTILNQSSLQIYSEVMEASKHLLERIKSPDDINSENIDELKTCLNKQKNILSSFNINRVLLLDRFFDYCIHSDDWKSALSIGLELLIGFRKYYGEYSPVLTIHYCKIVKLMDLLGEAIDRSIFRVTKQCLSITHGTNHPVYGRMMDIMKTV